MQRPPTTNTITTVIPVVLWAVVVNPIEPPVWVTLGSALSIHSSVTYYLEGKEYEEEEE